MLGLRLPHNAGGIIGMLVVAALYITYALQVEARGHGLGPGWLLMLLLPGALAAHLSWRSGMRDASVKEGALAGLVTAHFASALQVATLIIAVATIDWQSYAAQVGQQIAGGAHDAAASITLMLAALITAIAYAGCIAAGWLGALIYIAARSLLERN